MIQTKQRSGPRQREPDSGLDEKNSGTHRIAAYDSPPTPFTRDEDSRIEHSEQGKTEPSERWESRDDTRDRDWVGRSSSRAGGEQQSE